MIPAAVDAIVEENHHLDRPVCYPAAGRFLLGGEFLKVSIADPHAAPPLADHWQRTVGNPSIDSAEIHR